MNEQINDGGSAFPDISKIIPHDGDFYIQGSCGMTLRDYFAAKASKDDVQRYLGSYIPETKSLQFTVEEAKFRYADAMIKAREVKL